MTLREQAIKKIQLIRTGEGINKEDFPETMKGSIAKDLWENCKFEYGMEYGAILILMELFSITEEELK